MSTRSRLEKEAKGYSEMAYSDQIAFDLKWKLLCQESSLL